MSRAEIPPGGFYDATDFMFHQPGVVQKRGASTYQMTLTGATYASAVAFAEFPAGSQLVAVSQSGHGHVYSGGTDKTTTAATTVDTPKLRIGGGKSLLIFPNSDGTSAPTKYDGTANTALLTGTPAAGQYACIYKTRLVLGHSNANPSRLYFSPTPDIESTWDTTNSWLDCDHEITGLAALKNAILVFGKSHFERITGSTPPPGTDMDRQPVADLGCIDARSIVVQNDSVIFANQRGVFQTNGSSVADLTEQGGISSYWGTLMGLAGGGVSSGNIISAGLIRNCLVVSLQSAAGTFVDCLVCYLPRRAWWRLTNVKATMFATAMDSTGEFLYYADSSTNRITSLPLFTPSGSADADGTSVQPMIETRLLGRGTGLKQFGFAHLTYDLTPKTGSTPSFTVTPKIGLAATTGTLPPPVGQTASTTRARFTVGAVSRGFTLNLQHSATNSTDCNIYAIEYEERPLPIQDGGQ